jgi:predicted GH43/DUF377 family glycosyl hydrolase
MSNLVKRAVEQGGKLAPLVISNGLHSGTGLMNPSVFIDNDGDILVNLRHVNYTLCHSENTQKFPNRWGPLSYLHPENDQTLRTENYICRLDKNLSMTNSAHVKMLELHKPIWTFIGLEDARLVQWENKYYLIGVRRDTTTHGQGRMEYSHIEIDKNNWTINEIKRTRIPAPGPNDSYCEKNWVPIIDRPYHLVKWASPVEVVKADPDIEKCDQVMLKQGLVTPMDQRGGSQLVRWGSMYISITHDVVLFKNYLSQKDAIYRHRLLVWDDQINLVGISKQFSFLDGNIEFATGAAVFEDDLLITFGFQDNAAFILRTPKLIIEDLIIEALSYGI